MSYLIILKKKKIDGADAILDKIEQNQQQLYEVLTKQDEYQKTLFEWCYPELAKIYKKSAKEYPKLNDQGEFDPITDN